MSNIELFVKEKCKKPCELARNYIQVAINTLASDGVVIGFSEHNIDTEGGMRRYRQLQATYPRRDLGLPLTTINGEPFYVGASKTLPARIIAKIGH